MPHSSNGYVASSNPDLIGVHDFVVNGVSYPAGVKGGDVATILRYVCEQLHLHVEKAHPGWCWGYSYRSNVNNPEQLSDHSSATAIDRNAPAHPNGHSGTFTPAQVMEIRKILRFLEGTVKWGGDYHNTKDEMHWGISDETTRADVSRVADKVRRAKKAAILKRLRAKLRRQAKPLDHDGVVAVRLVVRGKTNGDILEVQRVLNRWYPHLDLIEDGTYGPATALAMARARRWMHLRGDVSLPSVRRNVLRQLGFKTL